VQSPLILEHRPALVDRRSVDERIERGEDDLALKLLWQLRERDEARAAGKGRRGERGRAAQLRSTVASGKAEDRTSSS
jgi:hypothetical protein